MLNDLRGKTKLGRISEDERAEVLEQFWSAIDESITTGELPEP